MTTTSTRSNTEWIQLINYVNSVSEYVCEPDHNLGSNSFVGTAIAGNIGWAYSQDPCSPGNNLATNNATGFSALPAGRLKSGTAIPSQLDTTAHFWSIEGYEAGSYYLTNATIYTTAYWFTLGQDIYQGKYLEKSFLSIF